MNLARFAALIVWFDSQHDSRHAGQLRTMSHVHGIRE
jgi:hypothetical protein